MQAMASEAHVAVMIQGPSGLAAFEGAIQLLKAALSSAVDKSIIAQVAALLRRARALVLRSDTCPTIAIARVRCSCSMYAS